MNLEELPRTVLTCGACLVSGFMIAMWCMPFIKSNPRAPIQKSGFSVTLPISQYRNPAKLQELRGKMVKIIRIPSEGLSPCIIDHAPLSFSVHENLGILSGSIETMENFVVNVSTFDLKSIELTDAGERNEFTSCRLHPKVSYGEY
jgi:hypothetical protein